jgi:S-adenosylmethionine:diacylglycerol 3-amino-3-carboxypropyl transferase
LDNSKKMIDIVSHDVAIMILKYLPFNEMIRIGRVNKDWFKLTCEPVLYEELTFQGLNQNNTLNGAQLIELIANKLINVEYVTTLDMSEVMSEKITGKVLREIHKRVPHQIHFGEMSIQQKHQKFNFIGYCW